MNRPKSNAVHLTICTAAAKSTRTVGRDARGRNG
jgi:hypothetical protein